jgi:hypothetical protein
MRRTVGKKIGNCVYVHKQYEDAVIPAKVLKKAKRFLKTIYCGSTYDCIKWDRKTNNITFQWSPNFNTANEPVVGQCFLVKADGTSRILPDKKDPQIWHHKWMWVADDYEGFDVEQSKARSKQWEPHVSKEEKSKIGTLSFWLSIRKRWE